MFEYKTTVVTPFCDTYYYLAPEYSMYYLQETIGRMAAACKCDIPELLKERKSWVVLSASVDVFFKPYWMTGMTLEGYCFPPSGRLVPRRVKARMPDGSYAFRVDSHWGVVFVDEDNRHRLIDPRVVTDRAGHDDIPPDEPFAERFKKLDPELFDGSTFVAKHKVLSKDCDINSHVNNLKYVSWIIENTPADAYAGDLDVSHIDICFSKEMHLGDVAELKYFVGDDGDYYVSVGNAAYAHLWFSKLERRKF